MRSSWLMRERNSLLARFARSASSLARFRTCSSCLRSVTSRTTPVKMCSLFFTYSPKEISSATSPPLRRRPAIWSAYSGLLVTTVSRYCSSAASWSSRTRSGMRLRNGLPTMSVMLRPKIFSAARFANRIVRSWSMVMMPSDALSATNR